MSGFDDYRDLCEERDDLRAELDRLRAANARLQAWHDAVMGLRSAFYIDTRGVIQRCDGVPIPVGTHLIIRPQPLAKE